MEAKELIEQIRKETIAFKALGNQVVNIDGLLAYLDGLEKYANESKEYRQQANQGNLAKFQHESEVSIKLMEAAIEAGKEAIKAAVLINGGAAVALLSFIASDKVAIIDGQKLGCSVALFAGGVLLGAVAFSSRYLSQFFYNAKCNKTGNLFNFGSWLLVFLSYVAFGGGIYVTVNALTTLLKH